MVTALLTILLFCLLTIPHELGHFFAARFFDVQVNEFSFGMGPLIAQREHKGTMFSLRAIPLGGYCAMEAENEASDNARAFTNKPAWQRLVILFAGAAMNLVIAVLLTISALSLVGMPTNVVDAVSETGPAYEAGIRAGDEIVAVNGEDTPRWENVVTTLRETKRGEEVSLTVERDGKRQRFRVLPAEEDGHPVVGITARSTHNVFHCARYGVRATWNLNRAMLQGLARMVTGGVSKDDVAGPVGMVQLVKESARSGAASFLYLAAIISINLAIINLLPFPALDGGRIILVLLRRLTGKVITDKMESYLHAAGMAVLLFLFLLVTWNDIAKLIAG